MTDDSPSQSSIVVNGWFGKIVAGLLIALVGAGVGRLWSLPDHLQELTAEVRVIVERVGNLSKQVESNTRRIDQGLTGGKPR